MKTFTLPKIVCINDRPEPKVLFSLFKKNGNQWVRVRQQAYSDYLMALRVFGLPKSTNFSIRAIELELLGAK